MLVMVVFFIAFRWIHLSTPLIRLFLLVLILLLMPTLKDRKSGSAGMPRPISYAVFCLKKKRANATAKTLPCGMKVIDRIDDLPLETRKRASQANALRNN